VINDEFIAAKLIGRWKDGSSLLRHPYEPETVERQRAIARMTASMTARLVTKHGRKSELRRKN
jgi:hypothetical protein